MELLYCCLLSGDATCGRRWLFDANFKLQAARWAETGYMLITLLNFSSNLEKRAIATLLLLGFSSKAKPQIHFREFMRTASSSNTGFDISEVLRIKTFSLRVAGYHLEIKAFKYVAHSSGFYFRGRDRSIVMISSL